MNRVVAQSALATLLTLLACGDDTSAGGAGGSGGDPSTGGAGAASTSGSAMGGAGGSGGDPSTGGAGAGGGASCLDTSGLDYAAGMQGEPACLTFESASGFCGFASDDALCEFSVSCGVSPDVGQCSINCEQGSSSFCNAPEDVDCVVAAFCADDCAALMLCDFIL